MLVYLMTFFFVGLASLWDLKTSRIPNLITFPAILAGISINTYFTGFIGMKLAITGMILGFLIPFIPFVMGVLGAGDVKLFAAVGALNGTSFVLNTLLYSSVAGGVIAIIVAGMKGKLGIIINNIALWILRIFSVGILKFSNAKDMLPVSSGIKFPYGIAIFIGTCAAYNVV